VNLKKIVEALLISTSEPLSIKAILALFAKYKEQNIEVQSNHKGVSREIQDVDKNPNSVRKKDIEVVLRSIMEEAETEDRAYRLVEGEKGFYISTAPQYAEYIRLLRAVPKPMKLTMATLETLSIIAYRQPVTRAEIESIRGVSVDSPINRLLEIELVEIMGRAELPGRPIQYGTGSKFLEFTGIKDLEDLPTSDILSNVQIDDFMRKDVESNSAITDETVGLAEEGKSTDLPLDETFVEVDWQKENIESDALLERAEGEPQ